jgi:hypothetical protein
VNLAANVLGAFPKQSILSGIIVVNIGIYQLAIYHGANQLGTRCMTLVWCVKAQSPHATASSATTAAPAAASSSKKSAKKAAKSAKKQAKQQPRPPSVGAGAMTSGTPAYLGGWALEWAPVVLDLARRHEVLRAAVLDGWQLLRWLEVRGLLLCRPSIGTLQGVHYIHGGRLMASQRRGRNEYVLKHCNCILPALRWQAA